MTRNLINESIIIKSFNNFILECFSGRWHCLPNLILFFLSSLTKGASIIKQPFLLFFYFRPFPFPFLLSLRHPTPPYPLFRLRPLFLFPLLRHPIFYKEAAANLWKWKMIGWYSFNPSTTRDFFFFSFYLFFSLAFFH